MTFIHQDVVINQILTAAIYNQTEQNILDHQHGVSGVSSLTTHADAVAMLHRVVARVTVSGTLVDSVLATKSIAGGTLGTDRFLRFRAWGGLHNQTGVNQTWTITIRYGGSIVFQYARTDVTGGTGGFFIECVLHAGNLTNKQKGVVTFQAASIANGFNSNFSGLPQMVLRIFENLAVDSTAAQTFELTVQMTDDSGNQQTFLEGAKLELMR